MNYLTTSSVRESIHKYKKKDSYSRCGMDICNFFTGKSLDVIASQPELLNASGNICFMKSRIPNSNNGKGKSSGYRIYYVVDKTAHSVTIIGFYPKTGVYGQDDIADGEYTEIVKEYKLQKQSGLLTHHNLVKEFEANT